MHSVNVIRLFLEVIERVIYYLDLPKLESIELGSFAFCGDSDSSIVGEVDVRNVFYGQMTMKGEMYGLSFNQ